MTDAGRPSADKRWRTVSGQAAVAVASILIGRWMAGATFGFVIYLLVWTPIPAAWIGTAPTGRGRWVISGATLAMVAITLFLGWPTDTVFHLFLIVGSASLAVTALALLLGRLAGESSGLTLAVILWLTWLVGPLLMAGPVREVLSDDGLARLLSVNPLIVCNAIDTSAGDWTHQSIAYNRLTRLGQDIPFDWPTTAWPCMAIQLVVALFCGGVMRIVPRGTN